MDQAHAHISLPPLRETIEKHGLWAKKSLGQNFILDPNITDKIVRYAGNINGQVVIEIGAGPGGLTRAILKAGAQVIAVEKDDRAIAALTELQQSYPEALHIAHMDALAQMDAVFQQASALTKGKKSLHIIANLPYNIATPLLTGWLNRIPWPAEFTSLTLMFQKEVANRITAQVDDKAYGRLAILTAARMHADQCFDLPPSVFVPPPKVTSTVVHFQHKKAVPNVDMQALQKVTAACFAERRKMLRQIFKKHPEWHDKAEDWLTKNGLDTTARAETLPPEFYFALSGGETSPHSNKP